MPSMNISLTTEMMKYVQSQVDSGAYKDASEFMSDAIRARNELKLQRLREALAPGIKALQDGDYIEYDSVEEFIKDMDGEEEA